MNNFENNYDFCETGGKVLLNLNVGMLVDYNNVHKQLY